MSAASRCKNFLRGLDLNELKSIKVKIKRQNVPEPDFPQPIYRGLDDPRALVVHFKREALRGIFDREDILVNNEFSEEVLKKHRSRSESHERRSISSGDEFDKKRNISRDGKYKDSPQKSRNDENTCRRTRSRSGDRYRRISPQYRRDRSRSPSLRKRSLSPIKDKSRGGPRIIERRSRSTTPTSRPIRRPGLYIPPKSDYLRYERKNTGKNSRSRSPVASYSGSKDKRPSSRSPTHYKSSPSNRKRSRTPHKDYHASTSKQSGKSPRKYEKRRSRSQSPRISSDRHKDKRSSRSPQRSDIRKRRLDSRSPKPSEVERDKYYRDESHSRPRSHLEGSSKRSWSPRKRSRTPKRRSRSPRERSNRSRSPARRNRDYKSRRSRSRSRHRDRRGEEESHYRNANMPPFIIKDGEYWVPAGPIPQHGYVPRGYLPPPIMYPRGFPPPMILPRMPMPMMQPYRPRMYRPRIQPTITNATATVVSSKSQDEQNEQVKVQENPEVEPHIEEPNEKETTGVTISEIK